VPASSGHGGGGILREQQGQGYSLIEQGPFVNHLAGGIQDGDVMIAVAEIETEGEPAGSSRGGTKGGYDGRSVSLFVGLFFHRQRV